MLGQDGVQGDRGRRGGEQSRQQLLKVSEVCNPQGFFLKSILNPADRFSVLPSSCLQAYFEEEISTPVL